ncbi:DNA translocase FtsK 4TM domain-containing protein, partial [Sandarakinorhabdus sp.]|uniref:DNA translocase FtsK 4TM domain-containing protein n=1 Tax=Sandarakinorhabdus sp. TaxID=1916663 RepID=UPI00286E6BFA
MATRATASPNRSGERPAAPGRLARLRTAITSAATRLVVVAGGGALIASGLALAAMLISYSPLDPSFNTVTARAPGNILGLVGGYGADALLHVLGWPSLALAPLLAAAGVMVMRRRALPLRRMILATLLGMIFLAMAAGASGLPALGAPAGSGGLIGLASAAGVGELTSIAALADMPIGLALAILLAPAGLFLLAVGTGLGLSDFVAIGSGVFAALPRQLAETDDDLPVRAPSPRRQTANYEEAEAATQPAAPRTLVVPQARGAVPGKRQQQDRQQALDLGDSAILPSLDLLLPPPSAPRARIDAASLEQNARLLEGVLEDFGVRGRIGEVRPGPVVTMYELEPAPGIKASRVIGLADDIARSMSALSARVAVVPGKNVIGIELPNASREMVSLSELLGSAAFENRSAALPIVLGKDIAGDPVIADLAPMPHLLIAGTTGSGKSVGLNAMILSLLY